MSLRLPRFRPEIVPRFGTTPAPALAQLWVGRPFFAGASLFNVRTAGSVATSIGIAMGNTLEALVGAYLVRRFANGPNVFDRTQDAFKFVICAAVLSTTLSASIG